MEGGGSETVKDSMGFFKYVFNFEDDNKANILNMLQFSVITIIPIMILLHLIKEFIPDVDDKKSTIEILAESLGQVFVIFMGVWFIYKMVNFIPTYSGKPYSVFNETTFALSVLIALFTMQTRLGEKFHILLDRVMELWEGKKPQGNGKTSGVVTVSQPLSQNAPMHQVSRSDNLMNVMPSVPPLASGMGMGSDMIKNFNGMYEQSGGAQQPQQPQQQQQQPADMGGMGMMSSEPMAANEACMGMFGGSSF